MMNEASRAEIERTQLQTKENDSNEDMCFQNIGKSLSRHQDILEGFVSAADAQKGLVDAPVKLQVEKPEENADHASQEKNNLPDVMKDAADILRNMQKSLSRHQDILEGFVSAADAQKGLVDALVKLQVEKPEENADHASQEKNNLPDVMKDAADILRNMQKSGQSLTKSLTNSFEDIRRDINKCLEQFEKDVSVIDIQRQNQVPESSQEGNIEEIKRLKETIRKQKTTNEEIQRQISILKNEVKQYRPANVSATVQLFHTLEGNSSKEIEKELITTLSNKLRTMNFIPCRSASVIDDKKLVIALCIVSTRLGSDAAAAIKDIQNPGNAALLIIYIAEAHSLPGQNSSRSLTDQKFKNLRHIFELTFKSGNGFDHFSTNEQIIDELCSFCKESPYGDKL